VPHGNGVIFAIAALDAALPLLPSETMLIAAGVVAAVRELSLALVIATGAAGAFVGESGRYVIGRAVDSKVRRIILTGRRGAGRLLRVERAFGDPAGLTDRRCSIRPRWPDGGDAHSRSDLHALRTLCEVRDHRRSNMSAYGALLGYAGGRSFEDEPLKALLLGLGVAAFSSAIIEALRRWGGHLIMPLSKQRV